MTRAPFHIALPDDEVPYSTVVRYALLSGIKIPKIYKKIFDNSRKRVHPYLPNDIARFAEFFDLDSSEVLANKTLFPFLQFTQPDIQTELRKRALSKGANTLFSKTVFAHSKISTFYGLKLCPVCVEQDLNERGFTYWRIGHQIPGIDVCHLHHCYLQGTAMGDGNKDRSLLYPETCLSDTEVHSNEIEFKMAKFAVAFLDTLRTEQINYRRAYEVLLIEKGLKQNRGHLPIKQITYDVKSYWTGLSFGINLGFPSELRDFEFLGSLLRNKTHYPQHPCKHLLFAGWLTDCQPYKLLDLLELPSANHESKIDNSLEELILDMARKKKSMNRIMRVTGKSKCFVKRVIEVGGIVHESNSMALPASVRRVAILKAILGIHRKVIADSLNISIGMVEQIICNTRGLSEWRRHLNKRKHVRAAYKKISDLTIKHPNWSRKQIRQAEEAAFFCLYNNDKALLEKVLPQSITPTRPSKNWALEDQILLDKITNLGDIKDMSLAEITRMCDRKGYLKKYLNELPLTKLHLKKHNIKMPKKSEG